MSGANDDVQHLVETLIAFDHDHLRPGNHDLADLRLGNLQHTRQHFLIFGLENSFVFLQEIVYVVSAQGLTFDRANAEFEKAGLS